VVAVHSGGGSCSFRVRLGAGAYDVTARYVGDHDYRASIARTSLLVLESQASG
jgi:hypothetical protein